MKTLRKKINNRSSIKESPQDLQKELDFIKRLRKARLLIFQVQSLKDLSSLMKGPLLEIGKLDSMSIVHKDKVKSKKDSCYIRLPQWTPCYLCFKKKSASSEKKLFYKIAKAVDTALQRMEMDVSLQTLKSEWKAAFNAIQKPICLTDPQFHILSSNAQFLQQVQKTKSQLFGQNCFSIFFDSPLSRVEIKNLKKSKILKTMPRTKAVFEIHCQSFLKEKKNRTVQLVIFTDMSRKIEMEKKISHLKKSAELGIITSSIAHDLNNPLAGIQALLEISQGYCLDPRIDEMMTAVVRCQRIVKKLLNSNSVQELLNISEIQKDKSLVSLLSQ